MSMGGRFATVIGLFLVAVGQRFKTRGPRMGLLGISLVLLVAALTVFTFVAGLSSATPASSGELAKPARCAQAPVNLAAAGSYGALAVSTSVTRASPSLTGISGSPLDPLGTRSKASLQERSSAFRISLTRLRPRPRWT